MSDFDEEAKEILCCLLAVVVIIILAILAFLFPNDARRILASFDKMP